MKKETLISVMKELKEEGKVKEVYSEGFTIEDYKDKYGDDCIIDYGEYVLNSSFHCKVYSRIQEYFGSKAKLKAFIEKVIEHRNQGYRVYNLVDELIHEEYCEKEYYEYLDRIRFYRNIKKSNEDTSC